MNKHSVPDEMKQKFRALGHCGSKDFQDILEIVRANDSGQVDQAEKTAIALWYWLQHSLDWNTTCTNCARVLDSAYAAQEEAHDAREQLETLRSLLMNED